MQFKDTIPNLTLLAAGLSTLAFAVPLPDSNSTLLARAAKNDYLLPLPVTVRRPDLPDLDRVLNTIGDEENYKVKPLGEGICDYEQDDEGKDGGSYDVLNDDIDLVENELIDIDQVSNALRFDEIKNGTELEINIGNPYPYKSSREMVTEKFGLIINETGITLIDLATNVKYLLYESSKPPVKTYNRLQREGLLDPNTYLQIVEGKSKSLKTLITRIISEAKIKHEADVQRRKNRKEKWKNRKAVYDTYNSTNEYLHDKAAEKTFNFAIRHKYYIRTNPIYIVVKIHSDGGRYARNAARIVLHLIAFQIKFSYNVIATSLDLYFRYLSASG